MIRFILISLVIYLGFRYVIAPLLRILLQNLVKKAVQNQFGQFKNQKDSREPSRQEGSIRVDYIPNKEKPKGKKEEDEGEYIDYEEVK
jgi:hypothetical protein